MIRLPRNEGLNIVPFIDIMLVLLAIVLSISTFIAYGHIKVELPKSQVAQKSGDKKEKVLVSIDEKDIFYYNDTAVSLDELASKLQTLEKSTLVELKADKSSKFESFIELISLLKARQHENFQILTEKTP